jgi:hypothetical protein
VCRFESDHPHQISLSTPAVTVRKGLAGRIIGLRSGRSVLRD